MAKKLRDYVQRELEMLNETSEDDKAPCGIKRAYLKPSKTENSYSDASEQWTCES